MTIEIKNISKLFGTTQALNDVSLIFDQPKIYGLLGNNGAGKTTILNIITNRLYPNSGELLIDGESCADNDNALSKVYLLSEKTLYPEDMKVKNAFKVSMIFYKDFRIEGAWDMAKRFGLDTNKKIKALSTGYSSIFKLIISLNVNTPYLLLDEPVLGLDAQHRDLFYKMLVESYADNPRIIVISTHLIAEVANLIEHTVIIHDGKILKNMPSDELLAGGYTVSGPTTLMKTFIEDKEIISQSTLGGLETACISGQIPYNDIPENLEITKLNLQDYFIQLMNKEDKKND